MAKTKKKNQGADDQRPDFLIIDDPQAEIEPGPVLPVPPASLQVEPRDRLFDLYVARVAKAETVNTMRRDGKAIFRDAFLEARVALDVYLEEMGVKS